MISYNAGVFWEPRDCFSCSSAGFAAPWVHPCPGAPVPPAQALAEQQSFKRIALTFSIWRWFCCSQIRLSPARQPLCGCESPALSHAWLGCKDGRISVGTPGGKDVSDGLIRSTRVYAAPSGVRGQEGKIPPSSSLQVESCSAFAGKSPKSQRGLATHSQLWRQWPHPVPRTPTGTVTCLSTP